MIMVNDNNLPKTRGVKHGHHGYGGEGNFRSDRDYVMGLLSAEAILPLASKINQVRPAKRRGGSGLEVCGGTDQK